MTITVFPVVRDIAAEHIAPRGSNTPQDITIATRDIFAEHRFGQFQPGPGADADIIGGHVLPPALPALGNYVVKVTDIIGGFYATLTDKFTCTRLHWVLNGHNEGSIAGPLIDPNLNTLLDFSGNYIDGREVRVERDDLGVMMQFVPQPRANAATVGGPSQFAMEGKGPTFHLTHKYVGRNNAVPNFIRNGNFDTDVSEWAAGGGGVATFTWSPSPFEKEPGAAVITSALAGDHYVYQTETVPILPYDTFMWFSAWVYIDSSVDVRDLATSGRALWTVWRVGSTVVWQQGVSPNWRAPGNWQNIRTKVFIPKDQTVTMETRLYVPKGTIRYDDIYAHREERLNCEGDPGTIIGCLVSHAQDTGLDKTDVNLGVDTSRGAGGVNIVRRYKYAESARIDNAMSEMASLQGGVDWLCETPNTNTRTIFTMERTGWDPGDSDRVHLVWGDNLNRVTWIWNQEKRADIVRVQGRGSGDEVTETVFNDPDSDLGWEFVRFASIEGSAHPEEQAEGLGRTFKRPLTLEVDVVRTATFDVAMNCSTDGGRSGGLLPGRLIDVDFDYGPVHIHEQFKCLDTILDTRKETATLQLVSVSTLVNE